MLTLMTRETPLPGGSRYFKVVWTGGKPPRYWVILSIPFLAFCLVWVLFKVFFWRFGQNMPDSMHSSARFFYGRIYYFPALVLWMHDFGLFVVMAWIFVLGVIMAFYRKMVPRDS
jgi:hypothetical protein